MTRELLQQALEAMDELTNWDRGRNFIIPYRVRDPIHASAIEIRAHLANPQGEPERPINCGTSHCSCIECVVQETCKWTEDDDGWETSCGSSFEFNWKGPVENGVKFCHGCGKPVEIEETP